MPFRGQPFSFLPLPTPYPLKITSSLPAEKQKGERGYPLSHKLKLIVYPCIMRGFFYERNKIYDSEVEKEK